MYRVPFTAKPSCRPSRTTSVGRAGRWVSRFASSASESSAAGAACVVCKAVAVVEAGCPSSRCSNASASRCDCSGVNSACERWAPGSVGIISAQPPSNSEAVSETARAERIGVIVNPGRGGRCGACNSAPCACGRSSCAEEGCGSARRRRIRPLVRERVEARRYLHAHLAAVLVNDEAVAVGARRSGIGGLACSECSSRQRRRELPRPLRRRASSDSLCLAICIFAVAGLVGCVDGFLSVAVSGGPRAAVLAADEGAISPRPSLGAAPCTASLWTPIHRPCVRLPGIPASLRGPPAPASGSFRPRMDGPTTTIR